ncbi:MAG: hypothetical protein KGD67_05780 [Candidatus Lokiarchaeota archaeon]|nr:hypothetical protein [Candidatus Lokiarchaeota archaeon]
MILKLFIIGPGGILYYSKSLFTQNEVDEGILSNFLSAFSDFAKEIKGGEVKALVFKEFNFIYSYSQEFKLIFVIVIDKDVLDEEVKSKAQLMKKEFIKRYKPHLINWSGNISIFEEFDKFVEDNIFIPPKILITGEIGVGKTTIFDLFPGETIVEIDDELNQLLNKSIKIENVSGINEFTIREIDLNYLVDNFSQYKDLLNTIDIILVISNSAASNLGRTQDLISILRPKLQNIDFYLLANFQDIEDTAFKPQKIEEGFNIKTYGFSAIEDNAKDTFKSILIEVTELSLLKGKKRISPSQGSSDINLTEHIISDDNPDPDAHIDYSVVWKKIDEAKILEKHGDHIAAAEKFASAANQFKNFCSDIEASPDNEMNAIYYLCRAWECMELAEEYREPDKYSESVELFNKASECFADSKYKLLAQGTAAFCQALELGYKFDKTSDKTKKAEFYTEIKMMLRNAANSYRRGGFENEADWALANSTYFDATWYIISSDEEHNLDETKRLLDIGSKMLLSAAEIFRNLGYEDKEKEVLDQLGLVQKKKKIILSALNTLNEPSLSKNTIAAFKAHQSESVNRATESLDNQKKYKLLYKDLLQEYSKIQKRECRIAIAQIGVSSSGDLLNEYYEEKTAGLIGLRAEKVDFMQDKIRMMIESAHKEKVNILIFPEMAVDLNYSKVLEEISDLAKSYKMYIIPGSFHNLENNRNTSIVIGPEGILWEQEKHIPAIIHFQGKKFEENIKVGRLPKETIICNTEYGRIAIVICRDFLDMDLRVELKNFEPPIDIVINPAYTPVTADFKAAHFDARRSIYAYCFFVNIAEYGESLIYTPEKDRIERLIPPKEETLIYKDLDLFKLRSERKKWDIEHKKKRQFIQSTR